MKQVFSLDEYKWKVDHETRTLTIEKREETAQQWVARIYQMYCEDKSRGSASIAGPYTAIIDNNGNIGKSICHPADAQDMKTGVAIAYARLKNIPIHPDFVPFEVYKVGAVVYDTRTGHLGTVKRSNGHTREYCLVQFANAIQPSITATKYLRRYTN